MAANATNPAQTDSSEVATEDVTNVAVTCAGPILGDVNKVAVIRYSLLV